MTKTIGNINDNSDTIMIDPLTANIMRFLYEGYMKTVQMNEMMEVGNADSPTVPTSERLIQFRDMLMNELEEIEPIIKMAQHFETLTKQLEGVEGVPSAKLMDDLTKTAMDTMVGYADLLGDLNVFCTSESIKHGYGMPLLYNVIMDSNLSKAGPDGKRVPHPTEPGKFGKGPNYFPAEPVIRKMFTTMLNQIEAIRQRSVLQDHGIILPQ